MSTTTATLDTRVTDLDAYIAYLTLQRYCADNDCHYCIICTSGAPCCPCYKVIPRDFPTLNLNYRKKKEIIEYIKKLEEEYLMLEEGY